MSSISKRKTRLAPYRVTGCLLFVLLTAIIFLMAYGVGQSYGTKNSVFQMVNYVIGLFYITRANVQQNLSQLFLGVGFFIFLIGEIKALISSIRHFAGIKKYNDNLVNRIAYVKLHQQVGRAFVQFVSYVFYAEALYQFPLNLETFLVLAVGSFLLILSDCVSKTLREGWGWSIVFSFLKSAAITLAAFQIGKFLMKPYFHMVINGFSALSAGTHSVPLYTIYTYLFQNFVLIACVFVFLSYLETFAEDNSFTVSTEAQKKSKRLMIYAIVVLFAICVASEFSKSNARFYFSFDKLVDWMNSTKTAELPFALFSISLFVVTLFSPLSAGASIKRKNKPQKIEPAPEKVEPVAPAPIEPEIPPEPEKTPDRRKYR